MIKQFDKRKVSLIKSEINKRKKNHLGIRTFNLEVTI